MRKVIYCFYAEFRNRYVYWCSAAKLTDISISVCTLQYLLWCLFFWVHWIERCLISLLTMCRALWWSFNFLFSNDDRFPKVMLPWDWSEPSGMRIERLFCLCSTYSCLLSCLFSELVSACPISVRQTGALPDENSSNHVLSLRWFSTLPNYHMCLHDVSHVSLYQTHAPVGLLDREPHETKRWTVTFSFHNKRNNQNYGHRPFKSTQAGERTKDTPTKWCMWCDPVTPSASRNVITCNWTFLR